MFASLAVAGAFLLRMAFDSLWVDRLAYVWFFLALLVVVRCASIGPQIFVLVASVLVGDWFFVTPRGSMAITSSVDQINTGIFIGVSALVMLFSARARWRVGAELAARDKIAGILECTSDAVCTVDGNWQVSYFNQRASQMAGMKVSEVLGCSLWALWPQLVGSRFEQEYRRVMEQREAVHFEEYYVPRDQWIEVHACGYEDGIAIFFRDVTNRKRAEAERERLLKDLQTATAEVKTLSGLLPICAQCKKIRDDRGYWNQIEAFIGARSNAKFSHGICPDCIVRLYPTLE